MDADAIALFNEVADRSPSERDAIYGSRQVPHALRVEVESLLRFDAASGRSFGASVGAAKASFAHADVLPAGSRFGSHRLVRVIGCGGMGTVYEAEQDNPRRTVALKVVRAGVASAETARRIKHEAEMLGRLQHPGIAQVYQAGTADTPLGPQPYFAMEHVRGEPLVRFADSHGLATKQRLELFERICEAVHHAHQRGIIHRDLKPDNILVDESGQPKILDFGVARLTDSDIPMTRHTHAGQLIGTLAYMSPEQVSADPLDVDTRSDVYALGVILYELLAGRLPYDAGGKLHEVVRAIREDDPVPLGSIDRSYRGDIETIVAKALEKDKARRYGSATALSEDIRRYLQDEPIVARRSSTAYQLQKFARRNKVVVAAAGLTLLTLLAALAVTNRERVIAERRFSELRQLSNKVFELDGAIRTLQGSTEARKRLLSASLEYLEGLSNDVRNDPDLARELAEGYSRVAHIQGLPSDLNLGDFAGAEQSLRKADGFIAAALAARPADPRLIYRAANIAHDRMVLAESERRRADALAFAQVARRRFDEFLDTGQGSDTEKSNVAGLYGNIALAHLNLHLYREAVEEARRQVTLAKGLTLNAYKSGNGLSLLASALRLQGDLDGALSAIREAVAITEGGKYKDETARSIELYGVLLREGLIEGEDGGLSLGHEDAAIAAFERALDLNESIARQDASDSLSRGRAATAGRELANIVRHRDAERALALYDAALGRLREMKTQNLKSRRDQALTLAESTYPLRRLNRHAEAAERIDAAIGILRDTKDLPAEHLNLDDPGFAILRARADDLEERGDVRQAVDASAALLRQVSAGDSHPQTDLRDAVLISRLYDAQKRRDRALGDMPGAAALHERQRDLWREWSGRLPGNSFVLRQLAAIDGTTP